VEDSVLDTTSFSTEALAFVGKAERGALFLGQFASPCHQENPIGFR
jgi:hypothetical protein